MAETSTHRGWSAALSAIAGRFVRWNRQASEAFDRLLPEAVRTVGSAEFSHRILPSLVKPHMRVYELGGGSRPQLRRRRKRKMELEIVGLDISAEELAAAPAGIYDRMIAADLTEWTGDGDGDLVICRAALEHVENMDGAIRGIASALAPGGTAALFIPCRNALFARLNLILPEAVKRRLLFALLPEKADGHSGFPAYYDRATPSKMKALADAHGLDTVRQEVFWNSSYFSVLLPLHLAWRAWSLFARRALGDDYCESFVLILRKR